MAGEFPCAARDRAIKLFTRVAIPQRERRFARDPPSGLGSTQ